MASNITAIYLLVTILAQDLFLDCWVETAHRMMMVKIPHRHPEVGERFRCYGLTDLYCRAGYSHFALASVRGFITYDPQIEQLTKLLFWEMQNNSLGGKLYLESLTQVLVINLLRNYSVFEPVFRKYNDGLAPYKLRQTIDYIHAYLDRDLSLKVMAEQIGMSRSYFAVRFKQAMGISPHQYVNQQRIKQAKQLLKERKLAIAEIALECGFASQSHLNKVFCSYVGMTPKSYREQL